MVPGTRDLFLAQVEASQSLALAHSPATIAVRMFCMVPPPPSFSRSSKGGKGGKGGSHGGGGYSVGIELMFANDYRMIAETNRKGTINRVDY